MAYHHRHRWFSLSIFKTFLGHCFKQVLKILLFFKTLLVHCVKQVLKFTCHKAKLFPDTLKSLCCLIICLNIKLYQDNFISNANSIYNKYSQLKHFFPLKIKYSEFCLPNIIRFKQH